MRKTIIDIDAKPGGPCDETVTRREPANFNARDRPLSADDLSKCIAVPHVAEHRDVTITAEGVLYKNGTIMDESFARPENFRRFRRKRVFKRYEESVKLLPVREAGSVLWITDDWSKGYFHWLADVLPKLIIAAEHLKTSTVLLPGRFRDSQLAKDSLELFGVRNFQFVGLNETVRAARLFLPFHAAQSGDFDTQVIRQVGKILVDPFQHAAVPDRRIYISRAKAKRRKIVNEAALANILGGFGFESIYAEDLSFAEQVRLFASTSHLISIHGAGLSNMLFMPAGGKVFELRKDDPAGSECFLNMASALGREYHHQFCSAKSVGQPPYSADLLVDIQRLIRNLRQFL
ncbi:MAG: glycosyltransferase family 61 protein [Acidobacteriota bacterium]